MDLPEFSVHWKDCSGEWHQKSYRVIADIAAKQVLELQRSIQCKVGLVRSIIIRDGRGNRVFEWQFHVGTVWI